MATKRDGLREAIEALATDWAEEGPSLARNAYSGRDVVEGEMLQRHANDLRRILAEHPDE
jgi:hypothetical protein